MPLRHTPVAEANFPVCSVARAGPQTGWQVNVLTKCVPACAMRSKFGVRPIGFPCRPVVSARC